MVACSSGGAPDVRDAGVLSDVRDVIRDVLDVETRDAHAGGDGGTPTCNCPETSRPEYSFSGGAITQEGAAAQEPVIDFSTVVATGTTMRLDDGALGVRIAAVINYHFQDGAEAYATCTVVVRSDRSVVPRMVFVANMQRTYDTECSNVYYRSVDGITLGRPPQNVVGGSEIYYTGTRVMELTADHFVVVFPAIPLRFRRSEDGGEVASMGSLAPITVRASVPGATWLTPPRMYRP